MTVFSPSCQTPAGTAPLLGTPPLQNLEPVENKLRKKIQGCWRQFLKECKEKDVHKQGEITASEFLGSCRFWSCGNSVPSGHQVIPALEAREGHHRGPASPPGAPGAVAGRYLDRHQCLEGRGLLTHPDPHLAPERGGVSTRGESRDLVVTSGQNVDGDRWTAGEVGPAESRGRPGTRGLPTALLASASVLLWGRFSWCCTLMSFSD